MRWYDEKCGVFATNNIIYRTVDKGAHWEEKLIKDAFGSARCMKSIAFNPKNPNQYLISGYGRSYMTFDYGDSYFQIDHDIARMYVGDNYSWFTKEYYDAIYKLDMVTKSHKVINTEIPRFQTAIGEIEGSLIAIGYLE